jgi:selenide, water dikinase
MKLTSFSHGAGCACKLGLRDLSEVLTLLGPPDLDGAEDVLVGLDEADDAAVVRIDGEDVLILTIDFFTPLVDDAYTWGRIAAANAVSDVYAMGGRPLVALNVAAWPRETLPLELLADVLRGGRDIAKRGGFHVVGGHTIDDPEPKYGMVVVGRATTPDLMTIDAARPGDALVLTKPVGTGIITTSIKREIDAPDAVRAAVESMTHLSADASRVLVGAGVRACTDVTGFGFMGHLHRMLNASGCAAEIDAVAVPEIGGARELADDGCVPGGTKRNRDAVDAKIEWGDTDETTRVLLCDAQTSGGLLAAVPADRADEVVGKLAGELADAVVGRVVEGAPGRIAVR